MFALKEQISNILISEKNMQSSSTLLKKSPKVLSLPTTKVILRA